MSKRKSEAAWIESRQRWQIKVQTEGERRTFTSSIPGKKGKIEAEKKADDWLENRLENESTKCSILADQYLENLKNRASTGNYRQQKNYIENYIEPAIGHKKIGQISEMDFQKIVDAAYKKGVSDKNKKRGLSKKSLMNLRACISQFLKYCRRAGCTNLRLEGLTIPAGARPSSKSILYAEDIKKLFSSDETLYRGRPAKDWYINAYRLAVLAGLRPGETMGLKWEDIHYNKLSIRRAINDDNEITPGKNKNARRTIILPALALDVLAAQKAQLSAAGVKSAWVFPPYWGGFTQPASYRKRWKKYRDYNGIKGAGTPYELRHTFVSANKEMPEGLKKLIVGHSKDMDTEGTYGHEMAGDLERAAAYVDAAFRSLIASEASEK